MSARASSSQSNISYKVVNSNENVAVSHSHSNSNKKCGGASKKTYFLCFLICIVFGWIFVYYRLLNHRFELPGPLQQLRRMFGDGKVKKRHGREDETDVVTVKSEKPCLQRFKKERNTEVISFALVACKERHEDAIVSMKSIVLVTNNHIHFHIFTDDDNIKSEIFEKELKTWPAWREHWMMYTIHPIRYPPRDDNIDWLNLFKPCASQRLFLANILFEIDSLIYIDTDTIFLDAPENIWNIFAQFDEFQIAGLANECETTKDCWYNKKLQHPYFEPYGLNSGVMLMNLTRMRRIGWEKSFTEIHTKYASKLFYGDQDILNIYFHHHRNKLYKFPCSWNYRPDHCMHGNTCVEGNSTGVSIIHGNRRVFKNPKLQPEFFHMYQAFLSYDFKEKFPQMVVKSINSIFQLEYYKTKPCGKMLNAFLKHLTC